MMLKLKLQYFPPHAKNWLMGKDSDAGRDWGQQEKGTTEDEMAGWYYRLDGREFEWTLGVGDGQGGLVCCNSWGRKESEMTEWLNWTELSEESNHIANSTSFQLLEFVACCNESQIPSMFYSKKASRHWETCIFYRAQMRKLTCIFIKMYNFKIR